MHQQTYSVFYFDLSFKDWKDTGLITFADISKIPLIFDNLICKIIQVTNKNEIELD